MPLDVRRLNDLRLGFSHLRNTVDLEREYLQEVLDLLQTRVSTELNRFVRKITAWGTIGIAWTVIVGVYGMNFDNIPGLGWRFGYAVRIRSHGGGGVRPRFHVPPTRMASDLRMRSRPPAPRRLTSMGSHSGRPPSTLAARRSDGAGACWANTSRVAGAVRDSRRDARPVHQHRGGDAPHADLGLLPVVPDALVADSGELADAGRAVTSTVFGVLAVSPVSTICSPTSVAE